MFAVVEPTTTPTVLSCAANPFDSLAAAISVPVAGGLGPRWKRAQGAATTRNQDDPVVGDQGRAWKRVTNELLDIRTLRDDWDGSGAPAPSVEIVDFALRLTRLFQLDPRFTAPARATATPAGTVILEWQNPGGYLEMEITGPERVEWMLVDRQGNAEHGVFGR